MVSIEDSGTGIKDLDAAFELGNTSGRETPLNEHGFGLKHALASANPANTNWHIYTRTQEDFAANQFKRIAAPYKIQDFNAEKLTTEEEQWPGELNGPGTLVRFHVSQELFNTLRKGISGPIPLFSTMVDILSEDLGFIYAGLIAENKAPIQIIAMDNSGHTIQRMVTEIKPDWRQFYAPHQGVDNNADLGGGRVEIRYAFGEMNASNNRKYYKRNMSSSGLEIRLNGRVLAYNLFKDVWGIERHNMYNHLLVQVDVRSHDLAALPSTRTSKNGLREGDPRLEKLYEWVRNKMPDPPREPANAQDERDLFEMLRQEKQTHVPEPKTVTTEQNVYQSIQARVPIDLYLHYGNSIDIYEGKKEQTSIQDVYQLKMYWDGCVLDGLTPTKGILIAARHPDSVRTLVGHVNQMRDLAGNSYVIEIKTWREERIPYP